ncbi:MAG: very short patch repair endonuclease [Ancylobacter novellus]|uniref:Very short patch repair endonuclease n=1 Tax=Ancylobacter novellus TaxID=921 RepID=A0A2W5K7G5_ANCNO|nr:MAG: very short patch repair endonuclease [Ancylobacter novellus]
MIDRSAVMRAVKSRDTRPEMLVRRTAHALGYRFRLHRKDLPGSPDLVFPRFGTAVFVHGCFWHGHECARGSRKPKTNAAYWEAKIARNVARDERAREALEAAGWRVVTLWECELKDRDALAERLSRSLTIDRWRGLTTHYGGG